MPLEYHERTKLSLRWWEPFPAWTHLRTQRPHLQGRHSTAQHSTKQGSITHPYSARPRAAPLWALAFTAIHKPNPHTFPNKWAQSHNLVRFQLKTFSNELLDSLCFCSHSGFHSTQNRSLLVLGYRILKDNIWTHSLFIAWTPIRAYWNEPLLNLQRELALVPESIFYWAAQGKKLMKLFFFFSVEFTA